MIAILKKEFISYFHSMTGYIFLGVFILLTAICFILSNVYSLAPNYAYTLQSATFIFLIIIPTLTMRLFAEEARQKTDQLLFTSPVTISQIVIGKYLAAVLLFVVGMAVTAIFPMWIGNYGTLPVSEIITAFLGYTLIGFCFISVGLFVSVLTDNQIIAAVATFAIIFLFFIMSSLAMQMPADRLSSCVFIGLIILGLAFIIYNSTKSIMIGIITILIGGGITVAAYFINNLWFDGVITKVLNWLSIFSRFNNFGAGILDLADIVYYITFSAAFIYLSINAIEKRRWN